MTKDISSKLRSKVSARPLPMPVPTMAEAMEDVRQSVDRFCLLAGIEAMGEMLEVDAAALCGPRHQRSTARRGDRPERATPWPPA